MLLSLTADKVSSISPTLAGWFWVSPFIAFPFGITVAATGSGLAFLTVPGLNRRQLIGRWAAVIGAGEFGLSLAGMLVAIGYLLGSDDPPKWVDRLGAVAFVGFLAGPVLILTGLFLNRGRRRIWVGIPGELRPRSRRTVAKILAIGGAMVIALDLILNSGVPTSSFAVGIVASVVGAILLLTHPQRSEDR